MVTEAINVKSAVCLYY